MHRLSRSSSDSGHYSIVSSLGRISRTRSSRLPCAGCSKNRRARNARMTSIDDESHPARLLALGLEFWNAKVLLSAVELGVFSKLSNSSLSAEELVQALHLGGRGAKD